jgi:hypothetical protein
LEEALNHGAQRGVKIKKVGTKWMVKLAVLGMAAETNRLAEALRVPIDQGL